LRKSSEVVVFEIGEEFGKTNGLAISRRQVSERREAASPILDGLLVVVYPDGGPGG